MNKAKIKKIKNGDETIYDIKIPKNFKLFRMRADNEYCISAFMKDEIWGTVPEAFNDPYDTISIYDKKQLYEYAKVKLEMSKDVLAVLCDKYNINNDNMAALKLSRLLVDFIVNNDNIQRQKIYVSACFTEKIDNEIMWAHYANNARGFALEYDYDSLKEFGENVEKDNNDYIMSNFNYFNIEDDYSMPMVLLPIIYDNSKYDMTEYLKKVIDNELNNVKLIYIFKENLTIGKSIVNLMNSTRKMRENQTSFFQMNCFKKKDWKYECEWRLLSYNMNPFFLDTSMHSCIGLLKPSAIYLGEKISQYNKESLIALAKKKEIKVFQMESKMLKKTMKLIYKEIK